MWQCHCPGAETVVDDAGEFENDSVDGESEGPVDGEARELSARDPRRGAVTAIAAQELARQAVLRQAQLVAPGPAGPAGRQSDWAKIYSQ